MLQVGILELEFVVKFLLYDVNHGLCKKRIAWLLNSMAPYFILISSGNELH
jgi:hypothetical protein